MFISASVTNERVEVWMSVYAETKLGINYIVFMSVSGSEDIVWDGVMYPESSDQAQYTCPRGDYVEHE
jgi:hypothetical protein